MYVWLRRGLASDGSINGSYAEFRANKRVEEPDYDIEYILQDAAQRYNEYAPGEETLVPNMPFSGEDAQAVSEYTLTIGGYVNQAAVQFITGAMDIEKDWDSYIDTLKNMGVENFIEIYQRNYDEYMKNLG